jgi:hypothetical protein
MMLRCTGCDRDYDNGTNGMHGCEPRDRIAVLEKDLELLSRWIVDHHQYTDAKDWACALCVPHSDMLSPTFKCAYHRSLDIRAALSEGSDK